MKKTTDFTVVLLMAFSLFACGQTKKEHPQNEHPTEHPSATGQKSNNRQLTAKELSKEVKKYVYMEQRQNGGYFLVYDSVKQKELKLKLTKVHDDRLAALGNDTYFVCSDFKGTDGNTYDVDIFMKDKGNNFEATSKRVHKINGVARYSWYKSDDIWKTQAVGKGKAEHFKGSEHPN